MATAYDDVPYGSFPYHDTHPDHLNLIARLFRLAPAPAPPERCRVLEIGCAAGGNLLPMAEAFPDSHFTGIDLAASQIEQAAATARTAGLGNVEFHARDILALDRSGAPFDYILAHGVYSWVPDPVKSALLDVIGDRLAPGGVAYVSHNVKPGFYLRHAVREMMLQHRDPSASPARQVEEARELLGFLVSAAAARNDDKWRLILQAELEEILRRPDWLVFHDHLAPVNDGLWFRELVAELPRRGLQFLGDADLGAMLPPPGLAGALDHFAGEDVLRQEQYLDLVKNRAFRMTLLCRASAELDRGVTNEHVAALGLHVTSCATLNAAEAKFHAPTGSSARVTHAPTRAALERLAAIYPRSLAIAELLPGDLRVAGDLLQCWMASVVEFYPRPTRAGSAEDCGERPCAAGLARIQAAGPGPWVTNLRHQNGRLDEPTRRLLALLDGTRDRAELAAAVGEDLLGPLLEKLGQAGYLMAHSVTPG